MRGMKITNQVVVFDTDDLEAESTFWAGVLGGEIERDDDWHTVIVDGRPRVGVQLARNHVRPEWPNGNPQQLHLDLWVDDFPAAHAHVMAHGACVLKEAAGGDDPDEFQVYEDPAGHPFCLCWMKKPNAE